MFNNFDLIGSLLPSSNGDLLSALLLSPGLPTYLLMLVPDHDAHIIAHHDLPLGVPVLEELLHSYLWPVGELIPKELVCRLHEPEVVLRLELEARRLQKGSHLRRIL
jgi:hypothetical protein